jgi:hypothetical protein
MNLLRASENAPFDLISDTQPPVRQGGCRYAPDPVAKTEKKKKKKKPQTMHACFLCTPAFFPICSTVKFTVLGELDLRNAKLLILLTALSQTVKETIFQCQLALLRTPLTY